MAVFKVVNVIPNSHSGEQNQDSEPSIGVNPASPSQILISTFTPPDSGQTNGPLFVSQDGGNSWNLAFIVPGGEPLDQTYVFGGISGEFYGGDISGTSDPFSGVVILNALSTPNPFVPGTMAILESPTPTDQPFIVATTVRFGPDTGKDRFYIGYNDQRVAGTTGQTAAIDFCLDATASSPVINTVHLDPRATADWTPLGIPGPFNQDGPQVRTSVHADGTIYATYNGLRTMDANGNATTDIVVVRDDAWATGATPFTALTDPGDSKAGIRVQTGVSLVWSPQTGNLGQERAFGTFAIATDPRDSDIVYLAWAGVESGQQKIHLQRSQDRGQHWSGDLITPIANATNAALAISVVGVIGFMYQQLTGTAPNDRWETHFQQSTNGTTWTDTIICTTPAEVPIAFGLPYLGDYLELLAVGKSFYGTFCANNTPDPGNFPATPAGASNPNGAIFQRNVTNASPWNLLGTDGHTVVQVSIDPFFLSVVEVPTSADFYVRDWTDSPTSGDNGAEPSTHEVFWTESDVWNQNSTSVALPPNANDQPQSENALAGADNYGFARIRRNQLPAAGSGSVNVTAHFLISEFGTGSNFVDDFFSDPSDPDVSFPGGDVSVTFADTEPGPKVTPPTTWTLGSTSSDHLCIAVEITAPGDPMAAPGLTGHAPGQPGSTLSVINDNNKAQRNLLVTPAASGGTGGIRFGIVHNSATFNRDLVIGILGSTRPPEGTLIGVYSDRGLVDQVPWRAWGSLTLPAMQPGENRWLGVSMPKLPANGRPTVSLTEMNGARPVNGFSVGIQTSTIPVVIGHLTGYHERISKRLQLGFGVSIGTGHGHGGAGEKHGERFELEQRVRIEEDDLRIEIDLKVGRAARHYHHQEHPHSAPAPGPAKYEEWLRGQVKPLGDALAALGGTDPFGIASEIATLEAAPAGDLVALTGTHASVLDRFDAFMTMLQKATGDRADILQMAMWNRDLFLRSATLKALPHAPAIRHRVQHFIDGVEQRTARLTDYGALLLQLSPHLHSVAAGVGASGRLDPLINALSAAGPARKQEKAHRDLLLALQQYA
jgi:hypothetical protein